MLLSSIVQKSLYYAKEIRGTCLGLGVSAKNGACKYLICSTNRAPKHLEKNGDFVLNFTAFQHADDYQLFLSSFRPVVQKNCIKLFLSLPTYSYDGIFLGNLKDAEVIDGFVVSLLTDKGKSIPFSFVSAISDAIILQKSKPYPIGQHVPAQSKFSFLDVNL